VDLENNPDQLAEFALACRSAAWFWKSHGLNELADAGDFQQITKRINGDLTGEADRLAFFSRAQEALERYVEGERGAKRNLLVIRSRTLLWRELVRSIAIDQLARWARKFTVGQERRLKPLFAS